MNRTRAVLGGVALALAAASTIASDGAAAGKDERRLLELVNDERRRRELPPMAWNGDLAVLARRHAADMSRAGYLTHLSRADDADYPDRLVRADLAALHAAENVAFGSSMEDAHAGLMDSAGHRANILSPNLQEIGIGIVRDGPLVWVCQDFATLIPRLPDDEAGARLDEALQKAWRRVGGAELAESSFLAARVREALREMIREDRPRAGDISVPGPSWVFAYTTAEPGRLPDSVRQHAGRVRQYGAAVMFRRTPSTPLGLYWVGIALADPVVD